MSGTKFAYVKKYELPDQLLPGTFVVFRLDGHSFHRFSDEHEFSKPNDLRALKLMDRAAEALMKEYTDIVLGFGESDEYSFLLRKSTSLYNRRQAKIVSTLTSYFTSCYVFHWSTYFPDYPMKYPPSFDGRLILYPGEKEIRDYFSWRQADTHINNLYNTAFWALVNKGGQTTTEAHAALRGTVSKAKHEILFTRFDINYNDVDARFRKGSVIVRSQSLDDAIEAPDVAPKEDRVTADVDSRGEKTENTEERVQTKKERKRANALKAKTVVLHCDIISESFWSDHPNILNE
ncbi:tRNAHis guanylyltransferase [Marasmius fiardii PR-910]|nr:tRNAHis guanylyltransferase [Marasmius fiardii PR-910]